MLDSPVNPPGAFGFLKEQLTTGNIYQAYYVPGFEPDATYRVYLV